MMTPIILGDRGDVMFFESVSDLLSYIESPDIVDFHTFDSKGYRMKLRAKDYDQHAIGWVSLTNVTLEETCERDEKGLSNLLVSFLKRLGLLTPALEQASLDELVEATLTRVGYTR